MSAAATPIGATASQFSYAERETGRRGLTRFASDDGDRREAKHRAAVTSTLQWADEAAGRGDRVDALAWLDALESIGDKLPKAYEIKRDSWSVQLARPPG